MSTLKLRGYQQALIDETVEALRDHRSVLLQAPTGAGKTEMAVEIARRHRDKVVWFVCHRHEIVAQTSRVLRRAGVDAHGVAAPRFPEDPTIKIQVCSIGALHHRLDRYPPPDLIVLDECHHVAAPSWAKLVESFPEAKLLGLTATPERLDGRGLKDWFQHMIVGPDMSPELIKSTPLTGLYAAAPNAPPFISGLRSVRNVPTSIRRRTGRSRRFTASCGRLRRALSMRIKSVLRTAASLVGRR